MAQSHATNPEQGQNADVGRDGGSVAPPLVEPLEQIKEAVADTDNARNGDEMERQRRQDRQSDGGAQAHVEPVGRRGRARLTKRSGRVARSYRVSCQLRAIANTWQEARKRRATRERSGGAERAPTWERVAPPIR